MSLDLLTLQVVMSVVSFLSGGAMLALWLLNTSERGPALWAAAGILAGGLFPLTPFFGDYGMFLNMAFSLSALLFLLEGILRFRGFGGEPIRRAVLPFLIMLFVFFSYIGRDNAASRLLFSDAAFVIMLALIALAMLHGTCGAERIVHLIVALPSVLFASVLASRWYLAFSGEIGRTAPEFTKIVFLAYIPWVLGWTYGISMAVMFRKNGRISQMAARDDLTGLANRRSFDETLDYLLRTGRTDQGRFALFLMDVNGFKSFNDLYGHTFGDKVLVLMADAVRNSIRKGDFAVRFGGDEFLVLMSCKTGFDDVDMLKIRLRESIEKERLLDGRCIRLRVSIGTAVFPDDGSTSDELLLVADRRMYEEKKEGRPMSEILWESPSEAV